MADEQDGSEDAVRCWKVESDLDGKPQQVLSTFSGKACAVSADFPLVSARFAPNETIPVFWSVALLAATQTSNELKMKNPPVGTLTSSPDKKGQLVQITATQVRVCASRSVCDPTTSSVAASALQSGDFSTTGGSTIFYSLSELRVPVVGSYVIAAQVRVEDDEDPTISYYYSAFNDITVASEKKKTIVYDRRTTYCRRTGQSALASELRASDNIAESSSCEIQVVVESADVTQPNASLAVSWEATLTRDASKEIRLPTPLATAAVSLDNKYYEIVSSTIRVCRKGIECDEYSAEAGDEVVSPSGATVLFGNFTNGVAKFSLSDIKLPSAGMYTAFAHLVLTAPNSRRYDVTTYFRIVVTDEDVGAQVSKEQYESAESGAFYCWQAVGLANATSTLATSSVMAMAKNSECPYEVAMSLSSSSISATETVSMSWTVKQRSTYSDAKFSLGGVNLTTVHDGVTNTVVNLAQAQVYYCNESLCTPFSEQKQLIFAASATNFTDGEVSFVSDNLSFPSAGNYTLFVHAAMPNGDSFRFDSAAFAKLAVAAVAVAAPTDGGGSNVGTIVGVVAAVIVGVLLVLFAVVSTRRYLAKKQRREPSTKAAVFGFRSHALDSPDRGDVPTASRDSNVSDTSMSFMYVKAAPSPVEDIRANSLSYDPYSRPSFTELSMEDANYTFALPEVDDRDDAQQQQQQQHTSSEPQTYQI